MSFAAETENLVNELIQAEYLNACEKFGDKYHSLHEGYAILKEEVEEVRDEYNSLLSNYHYLWENIKDDDKDILSTIAKMQNDVIRQIKELAQVGAVFMKIQNTIGNEYVMKIFENLHIDTDVLMKQKAEIDRLSFENEQLKAQIEKMKSCDNCKYKNSSTNKCEDCVKKYNWELTE